MAADHKKTFTRYLKETWEGGDMSVIDEVFDPGFLNHNPVPGLTPDLDGERALVQMFLGAFSDFKTNVETAVQEGDRMVVRWTAVGTHTGPFAGVEATGKSCTMIGVETLHFKNDKIAEVWINFDMAGLLQQLGAIPAPG